ncbi:MAG: hypothetical protein MZW92_64715 [Comamonadaceae bacterium]|nr:hypothetical protein [Comamonadaceae bacterium]
MHQIRVNFEVLLFRSGERADIDVGEDAAARRGTRSDYVRAHRPDQGARPACGRMPVARLVAASGAGGRHHASTLDGEIIGKPDDAGPTPLQILRRLSGRTPPRCSPPWRWRGEQRVRAGARSRTRCASAS